VDYVVVHRVGKRYVKPAPRGIECYWLEIIPHDRPAGRATLVTVGTATPSPQRARRGRDLHVVHHLGHPARRAKHRQRVGDGLRHAHCEGDALVYGGRRGHLHPRRRAGQYYSVKSDPGTIVPATARGAYACAVAGGNQPNAVPVIGRKGTRQ
jgi:hypothetical protein